MSAPIELAYEALSRKIAGVLAAAGFITSAEALEVDPEAPTEVDGEPDSLESAAILLQLGTSPVRTLVGGGAPRYVVERQIRLELAHAGPDRDLRNRVFQAALVGLAPIGSADDPTLGGVAERCGVLELQDGDLPPNGRKAFLTFFVRVRSSDPLGLTA